MFPNSSEARDTRCGFIHYFWARKGRCNKRQKPQPSSHRRSRGNSSNSNNSHNQHHDTHGQPAGPPGDSNSLPQQHTRILAELRRDLPSRPKPHRIPRPRLGARSRNFQLEFSNFGPGIPEFSNFGTDLQGVSNRDAPSANVGSRMAGQISKSSSNSSSIATLPPFPDSSESNDNRNKIHADIHEQVSQIDEIDVGSAKKQITVDVGSDDKHIKIDEQHMNIGNFEGKRDRKWRAVLERSEHSTHELAAVDLAAPVSDRERALRASIGLAIQKMSFEHVELDISATGPTCQSAWSPRPPTGMPRAMPPLS